MKVTITDVDIQVEGIEPIDAPGIGAEVKAKIEFLQAFAFALTRLQDELGMVVARDEAVNTIQTAKGRT